MMLPALRRSTGVVTSADPTHGKLDGCKLQAIRSAAEVLGCYEFFIPVSVPNEVTAKAFSDVVNYSQNFPKTKETFSRMLCHESFRCGTVLSDRRLKPVFID